MSSSPSDNPTAATAPGEVRTYRGRTVEELIPRIRAELGAGAIILRERQGLTGGLGGFFAQRCVEIEAQAAPRVNVYAGDELEEDKLELELELGDLDEERELDETEFAAAATPRFAERLLAAAAEPEATATAPVAVAARAAAVPEPAAAPEPAAEFIAFDELGDGGAPEDEGVASATPFRAIATSTPASSAEIADATGSEIRIPVAIEGPAAPPPALSSGAFRAAAVAPPAPELVPEPEPAPAALAAPAVLTRRLIDRGMSPGFAEALVAEVSADLARGHSSDAALTAALRSRLAAALPTPAPLPLSGGAIAIVGPGGSGKTRTVAGLAIACAQAGHTIAVARLGAPERALELAELLRDEPVEVLPAMRTRATARAVLSARQSGLVIVDTTAIAPGERSAAEVLAETLDPFELDGLLLTVPVSYTARAAVRLVSGYAALAPTGVIGTHLDEGDELGAVAELALHHRVPAGHVLTGPSLGAGVSALNPASLAQQLLR